MSPFRKLKATFHLYKIFNEKFYNLKEKSSTFYQYILNHEDVINDFTSSGFIIRYREKIDGIKGFKDEIFF